MITSSDQWAVPRRVWMILLSWGLAVIMLAGLFSFALYRQQQAQDRAMCKMIDTFITDDPIPAGPEGDRIREARASMLAYRDTLSCPPRT